MYCRYCGTNVGYAKTHDCPKAGPLDHSDNFKVHERPECRRCKCLLTDKNSQDVGYCLPCFAEMMSDEEE